VANKSSIVLSDREEFLAKEIVNCAFKVHKQLGPELLERVYEVYLCHELYKKGIEYKRQVEIPIIYDNLVFNEGLIADVMVEDLIICELKAVEKINPVWQAQVISHLKLTGLRLGFLMNFNVTLFKDGIKRFIV
jgi:GxxExxY protein